MPEPPWAAHPALLSHLLRRVQREASTTALRWTRDGVLVEVRGDLDLSCWPQLAQVRDVLAAWSHRAVVDASGVTFVDVCGLRAVLDLAPPGGSLLLLEPSRPLLRLVDLLQASTGWPPAIDVGPREQALVLRRPADRSTGPSTDRPEAQPVSGTAAEGVLPPPRSC